MHPVGLVVAAKLLASFHTILFVGTAAVLYLVYRHLSDRDAVEGIATLPGFFIFNVIPFFRTRYDFLNWGFHVTGHSVFQFRLLRNHVIVISGEQARGDFLNAKGLDLQEGFRVLSGALPFVQGITSDLRQRRIAQIYKRLAHIQKTDHLTLLVPDILGDACQVMTSWGTAGIFDPFEKIYELVFQTTVRCLTATEIADDRALVARLKLLYDNVDSGTTPSSVLFPYFPSFAMLRKLRATKAIYDIVVAAVQVRKQTGQTQNDSLQVLLDAGDDPTMIVGFIMGLLIAGARSTGTTAGWLVAFLGCHPQWQTTALAEARGLVSRHGSAPMVLAAAKPGLSLSEITEILSTVPLAAWEEETPVLDALIRETLRIAQPHVAMRRNVGPELYLDGNLVPTGAFVVCPFSTVHLDPELYPDPWKFDPSRPPAKGDHSYIGWGGGRVNCLGTRLAKVEMKLIVSLLLLTFEFTTVDTSGHMANPPPQPNWNDILTCRPAGKFYSLKYSMRQAS
ncbi:cytochrome P450 [Vararia minispora EC-137]|uniref:Cytochrome P450 n=1 Tax=Vararia minispora EC-137 TaxID=1314806 RepID=A0ACB8QVE6_9AGAM|nr:cytochrome P450 [Vararia minispora EC-137]